MNTSLAQPVPPCAPPTNLNETYQRRRKAIFEACREQHPGCNALAVCDEKDICYLTGVCEGVSWLIVTASVGVIVTRHMLVREVRALAPDCEVLLPCANYTDYPDVEAFQVQELRQRSLLSVLVETEKISADLYLRLAGHCSRKHVALTNISSCISGQRAIKEQDEINAIRACVEIGDRALAQLIRRGSASVVGRSERELATELERIMVDLGADRQGLPRTGLIVASGPNSASAHHQPGSRKVKAGDTLLIDWGAELKGTAVTSPGLSSFIRFRNMLWQLTRWSPKRCMKPRRCSGQGR